ncbi:MAG: hypothetical protein GY718_10010 [Lentisphaerae bacterium]|nr:hypothetical protein [Lentisphaerota bacterium]
MRTAIFVGIVVIAQSFGLRDISWNQENVAVIFWVLVIMDTLAIFIRK